MSFNNDQKAQLAAPLNRAHVKERKQSGRALAYVEAWHAIAEANRIFGYDGWTRETLIIDRVVEAEREIGEAKVPGWGVTYICKVRIKAGDILREGCGSGHGIDRDLGLAHESALKEAESDAMKRALMTFGNPFGLALYDKTRENVVSEPPPPRPLPPLTEAQLASKQAFIESCKGTIADFTDKTQLSTWFRSTAQQAVREKYRITRGEYELLVAEVIAKGEALDVKA